LKNAKRKVKKKSWREKSTNLVIAKYEYECVKNQQPTVKLIFG